MKYGIKDYEELLDKAVQFMKNHGLYDSYWSRESEVWHSSLHGT